MGGHPGPLDLLGFAGLFGFDWKLARSPVAIMVMPFDVRCQFLLYFVVVGWEKLGKICCILLNCKNLWYSIG